jgi:CubicO group peptidase (beta-lactamase class C family)
MQMDTIFDIASLTKVTATLTCIMHLYEMDAIDIDDRVIDYIP